MLHSQPKSTVGTPAYIAPEVLLRQEYDGKVKKLSFILINYWHLLLVNLAIVYSTTYARLSCDFLFILIIAHDTR